MNQSPTDRASRTSGTADAPVLSPFLMTPAAAFGIPVCRLGLASHGQTALTPDDILYALERGVNFLSWPGEAEGPDAADAYSAAIASLGSLRSGIAVCVQFGARTAAEAAGELRSILATLHSDYIDVLTLYYVERPEEWREVTGAGGALGYLRDAQRDGAIRRLGITSHQRRLAADIARSGLIDALMIRYNAAHRGAEHDIFPHSDASGVPVIAYTALRWGGLLRPTPADPPGFAVPLAPEWYRFVLQSRSVAVTLAAPHSRAELEEDLEVLQAPGPLLQEEYDRLAAHGARVRKHAGRFP